MGKWIEQFSEEVQMPNKYKKKCLTFFPNKEMQIKPSLRFHRNSVRMATIKKTNTLNQGKENRWLKPPTSLSRT
jgi:hypothetical protein